MPTPAVYGWGQVALQDARGPERPGSYGSTPTGLSSWRSASATSSSTPANWTPGSPGGTTLSRSTSTVTTEATIPSQGSSFPAYHGQPRGFPAHRRCRGPPIHQSHGFHRRRLEGWHLPHPRRLHHRVRDPAGPDRHAGRPGVRPGDQRQRAPGQLRGHRQRRPVSDQTDYGIFWAEDPDLSPQVGGEDFWTVSLRLVPRPEGP